MPITQNLQSLTMIYERSINIYRKRLIRDVESVNGVINHFTKTSWEYITSEGLNLLEHFRRLRASLQDLRKKHLT